MEVWAGTQKSLCGSRSLPKPGLGAGLTAGQGATRASLETFYLGSHVTSDVSSFNLLLYVLLKHNFSGIEPQAPLACG